MARHPTDMTPAVNLTAEHGAGPVRTRRPLYVDLLPPCNHACPAGEDIQAWLDLAQAGKFRAGVGDAGARQPMPAVHGRVCYHPCEGACNRAGPRRLRQHPRGRTLPRRHGGRAKAGPPPIDAKSSGQRVLIVGAGPSGLSAAYHLTRLGHAVEIHEAGPLPGGMMHFGIPAYRLPRAVLMGEIARIERMGVRIVLNHKVEDLAAEMRERRIRRRLRRRRRACLQARRHSRPRRRARARCRQLSARCQHRHTRRCSAAASSSMAAATPRWMPPAPPAASAPPRR